MNREERIKAALNGQPVDRVPVAAWMHFSAVDQDPISLAEAEVAFTEKYDFDFIKMMPFGLYSTQDFGTKIKFYCTPHEEPIVLRPAINSLSCYEKIEPISGLQGTYGKQVEFARVLSKIAPANTPYIQTIFSPFSTLKKMAGDRIFTDLKENPAVVHQALKAITATTIDFIKYNLEAGVSGFFFATQNACKDLMTLEELREFGAYYDKQVIDSYSSQTWFNALHIHGDNIYFEELANYPVNCLNWHDRHTSPTLAEARKITSKCFLSGIRSAPYFVNGVLQYDDIIDEGSEDEIITHVQEAITAVDGQGLIIGPGCVVKPTAPEKNLHILRKAVEL